MSCHVLASLPLHWRVESAWSAAQPVLPLGCASPTWPACQRPPTTACRDVECLEQQGLEPRAVGTLLLDAFAQMTCE